MPRDSNGNTVPLPGTIVSTGDTVLPSQHNPMVNDVYAMMTQSLSRDGQGGMRSNLDMHGFRILNVGTATQPTDAVSLGQLQNGTPVGSVIDYAGPNAPSTWMFCYGQAVSRTTYAALFAAIGTTYGSGDGSTTFNLPDIRGRVVAGKDDMGGAGAGRITTAGSEGVDGLLLGGAGGKQNYNISVPQLPSHSHTGTTNSTGAHVHGISTNNNTFSGRSGVRAGDTGPISVTQNTESSGLHSHTFTTNNTGNGNAVPIVQPTLIMNKIIKVSY